MAVARPMPEEDPVIGIRYRSMYMLRPSEGISWAILPAMNHLRAFLITPLCTLVSVSAVVSGCGNDSGDGDGDVDRDGAVEADADGDADAEGDADGDDANDADTAEDAGMDSDVDADHEILGDGERSVSGEAFFFDAAGVGEITELTDVTGAEVFLVEYPERRVAVAADGTFRFDNIPDGVDLTVALEHVDFFPTLTATVHVGSEDVENLTFQAVTHAIAEFLGLMLGEDPYDASRCQMVVTVTAMGPGQESVYAPGEPGVVVTVTPEGDPVYFNTSVIPDMSLTSTTTDGGVIVAGAEPGTYLWEGHKEGLVFNPLSMRCIGGWLTNASPPYGMQAALP